MQEEPRVPQEGLPGRPFECSTAEGRKKDIQVKGVGTKVSPEGRK